MAKNKGRHQKLKSKQPKSEDVQLKLKVNSLNAIHRQSWEENSQ